MDDIFTDLFHRFVFLLFTPDCYQKFFYDLDFFNASCIKSSISKGLGLGIISGSLLVKLPQVIKVWKSKSAQGLSLMNVSMDLFGVTTNMGYSYLSRFPFSAWGDSIFILLQTAVIVILVLYYNVSKISASLFTIIYSSMLLFLLSDVVPNYFLWIATFISIPLMFIGKLSQAYVNFKNKSTGQLSLITSVLLLVGSLIRVFTSIQDTGDTLLIWSFSLASFANFIIVAQFYCYRELHIKAKKNIKLS